MQEYKRGKENIYTTSLTIVLVNYFFLFMGALLAVFVSTKLGGMEQIGLADAAGVFEGSDRQPFPLSQVSTWGSEWTFLYNRPHISLLSKCRRALTSLTTSFCIDFVGFNKREDLSENRKKDKERAHASFAILFL